MIVEISRRGQRGATLVVGLIMLVLLTLVVTTAFMLSSGNLKAVGNMQFRNEAIAAANRAIEQVLSSPFTNVPEPEPLNVDIDNDNSVDYVVWIGPAEGAPSLDPPLSPPTCIRASVASPSASSSLSLPGMSTAAFWNTVWDIDAAVEDSATGASVRVRQGVRVLLTQAQKDAVCH